MQSKKNAPLKGQKHEARAQKLDAIVRSGVTKTLEQQVQLGDALAEIKRDKLYKELTNAAGKLFRSWSAYCQDRTGLSGKRGDQLIAIARIVPLVRAKHKRELPNAESAYQISRLVTINGSVKVPVAKIKALVKQVPNLATRELRSAVNHALGKTPPRGNGDDEKYPERKRLHDLYDTNASDAKAIAKLEALVKTLVDGWFAEKRGRAIAEKVDAAVRAGAGERSGAGVRAGGAERAGAGARTGRRVLTASA